MAKWRAQALSRLPELHRVIAESDSVMALWIELTFAFEQAYKPDPPDESLIARIYSFADWCIQAPRNSDAGHDPSTAVTVAFYEHIPTIPESRQDMPRWFRYAEVAQAREVFSYLIGEQSYLELLAHMQRHQYLYRPRSSPR
jgi:hypothetical protein